MDQGYPNEADIIDYLDDAAIELVSEYTEDFYSAYRQEAYCLVNALRSLMALSVYAASSQTFNVRPGRYDYNGTIKTYTPGSAIDPTDNDTTYVWLNDDNTIGSGIDGDDWPATEHIKLAEIDVDSDGVITAIRDMRAVSFAITAAS
jgi:hypothetical protein